MKKNLLIVLFTFICAAGAVAWDFVPALDVDGALTYPITAEEPKLEKKFSGQTGLAASFMVNTDILPQLWFIPTVTFNYSNTVQPLNIEDERFLFAQWMDVYLSYGANYEFTDNWELRVRGVFRKDLSMQVLNEAWGEGLYDYSDVGYYIENMNAFELFSLPMEVTVGYKYIDRKFPNYTTLITDPAVLEMLGGERDPNTYTKEKDSLNYTAYLTEQIQWGDSKWYTIIDFTYDYIPFMEQTVIDIDDGSLLSAKRIDRYATLGIQIPYYADENSGVEFDWTLIFKNSNQNYFDQMGTTDPSDDVPVSDYYNYMENIIKGTLNYEFPMKLFTDYKPVAVLTLQVDLVNYSKRKPKTAEGEYINGTLQRDFNYTVGLDIKQNIFEWWSYFLSFSYTKYESNMYWEAYGLYNYSFITFGLGTALSF